MHTTKASGPYGALKDKFGVQWMVNYSPPREG